MARAPRPLAVLHLDRGYIDDSFTLSPDGRTLYYVATDGQGWSELRAAELRPAAGRPELELVPLATIPGPDADTRALLSLPAERVLTLGGRDEHGPLPGRGAVYGVRSRPSLQRRLDAALDFRLGSFRGSPAVFAFSYPDCKSIPDSYPPQVVSCPPREGDGYHLRVFDQGLRLLGQRRYAAVPGARQDVDQRTGDVMTPLGQARPLSFLDDYQTMVVLRDPQPGQRGTARLAFVDTLSGQVKKSLPVTDAYALYRLGWLFREHLWRTSFVAHDREPRRLELWQAARMEDVTTERDLVRRIELRMPGHQLESMNAFHGGTVPQRPPLAIYLPTESSLQAVRAPGRGGKERLLLSLLVNPHGGKGWPGPPHENRNVLCEVDSQTGEIRRLMDLPKDGYPWYAAPSGRLAVLRQLWTAAVRKEPSEPLDEQQGSPRPPVRRDTQLEIYDLGP